MYLHLNVSLLHVYTHINQLKNLLDTQPTNPTIIQCNSDTIAVDAHGNLTFPTQGARGSFPRISRGSPSTSLGHDGENPVN